jgi:hypothetical protein
MLNATQKKPRSNPSDSLEPDLVLGAENIAKLTGQKLSAVYYWASKGMYGDAVWKAGRRSLAASRQRLRNLGKQNPET